MNFIKEKLASRKFWTMVAGMVTCVMVFKGSNQSSIDSVASVIGMFGTAITYILVQGKIDHATIKQVGMKVLEDVADAVSEQPVVVPEEPQSTSEQSPQ